MTRKFLGAAMYRDYRILKLSSHKHTPLPWIFCTQFLMPLYNCLFLISTFKLFFILLSVLIDYGFSLLVPFLDQDIFVTFGGKLGGDLTAYLVPQINDLMKVCRAQSLKGVPHHNKGHKQRDVLSLG